MSAIKEPWEQEINDVAVTEKRIKSAEVCEESTTSDNKDDDAAEATQAHFAEVTDTLDEATRFLMLMLCEREVERKWKAERKYIHALCNSE